MGMVGCTFPARGCFGGTGRLAELRWEEGLLLGSLLSAPQCRLRWQLLIETSCLCELCGAMSELFALMYELFEAMYVHFVTFGATVYIRIHTL